MRKDLQITVLNTEKEQIEAEGKMADNTAIRSRREYGSKAGETAENKIKKGSI